MPLVLASASPRRQELLKDAGIDFIVRPANIPEIRLPSEIPKAFAERMAKEKARAVCKGLENPNPSTSSGQALSKTAKAGAAANGELKVPISRKPREVGHPIENLVLGADTIVVVGAEILGKPEDAIDAARILRLLSDRTHSVITGVCLVGEGFEDVRSESTTVYFSQLSESEIAQYIASGEPMDKAGAYAIQGRASRWISKIEGDYNNVVGLPVDLVKRMFREHEVG
jgi:septum formation protein